MANLRRINQEDLRNHNLSVTLDTLLRAQKPMSRADLAKETGLTKATLSLLASMLIESGVVQEGEPVVSTTYGRPSTPLEIHGGSIAGIGLQINTDGYGCLALDLNGDTLGREWVSEDMTGTDPYEIFAKLDAMAFPLESRLKRRGCKVVGAGLALPGIVTDDMWLLVARNLGWENVNLTRFNVVRRLDVVAGNEAKMAAIAQIPGYATERASFLNVVDRTDSFIYLSTDIGIGGAVVRDGEVVMGSHGFAGEIGHLSVAMDGPLCSCGRHGCLEAFCGPSRFGRGCRHCRGWGCHQQRGHRYVPPALASRGFGCGQSGRSGRRCAGFRHRFRRESGGCRYGAVGWTVDALRRRAGHRA